MPKGGSNKEGAIKLMNFLLSAKVEAERTKNLWVAPANSKSVELLPAELRQNTMLFPTKEQLANCEMLKDLGESLSAWDKSWTEVRASR